MPMKHNAMALRTPLTFFAGLLTLVGTSPSPGQTPDRPTPPAPVVVQTAIDNAKSYLYSRQKPDGTWENVPAPSPVAEGGSVDGMQWGGITALVVYSLLASGENPADPRLVKAIDFLRGADRMAGVYAIGMRAQVWPLLPDNPDNRRMILRDGRLLLDAMNRSGAGRGLYRYNIRPNGEWDHSASQIGVLGVWALAQAGYEVPNDYWQLVDAAWRANQRNGGWAYDQQKQREGDVTASMTAAGVATLFLTQDYLHAQDGLNCRGNITNRSIEDGLTWMGGNLSRADSSYALYGVERIGVASGYKYLGDTDWYTFGARRLISRQRNDGAWADGLGGPEANTAFGLLFLTRGRAPVLMSKLDYRISTTRGTPRPGARETAREANWNQRPRDAANVVRYVAKQLEKPLNWQITTLDAPVSELLDSPILYLSGNQAVGFTEAEEAKIRSFLQQGGILLANSDCNAPSFAQSVRTLGKKLFPDYDFRELPEDHPIYTRQQFPRSAWRQKPSLLALGNGAREMILLMPTGDTARAWQAYDMAKLPQFQLLANIHLYSVDKTFARVRGETYLLTPRSGVTANRTLKLARIKYPGNWDPEPAGWQRLAVHLLNTERIQLDVQTVELGKGALLPQAFGMAHLTGTQALKLTEAELAELKSYVDAGGTLLIDAAGGREAFAVSMDETLVKTFGDSLKELLPADAGLYRLGGEIAPTYRAFSRSILSGSELKAPRFRASVGKGNVFFSREDLTVGLVGQPVDGVFGYSPESALDLVTRVARWSLGDRPPPAAVTRPATQAVPGGVGSRSP
jgi:hypothetical protein